MIFAIDMGNTNIVLGCADKGEILFEERMSTNLTKTSLEYAIDFKALLELKNVRATDIEGAIISSVVPPITDTVAEAVRKVAGKKPLILGPGIKTGLNIKIDDPKQLGADLAAGAVAALEFYEPPLAVIDMGTATTISYIDAKGRYCGGSVIPGVATAVSSLVSATSQLMKISLMAPKKVIGTNTVDCMKSGAVYGNAALIDGMLDRMEEETGEHLNVVATGGIAKTVIPFCRRKIVIDDSLLLKGLLKIYDMNSVPGSILRDIRH